MTLADGDTPRHHVITEEATASTLSHRTFLAATLATGILSTLSASRSVASDSGKRLVAGTRTLEVNGRAARVYSLIGPDGRPGIRLRAHERFRVELANRSGKQTLVHWHGQLPPWTQDGFPWPETPPLGERSGALLRLRSHSRHALDAFARRHAGTSPDDGAPDRRGRHSAARGSTGYRSVAIDGRLVQGAVRDTVLVMPGPGRVRIAFDADNPGRWAFHCHNLYHMQTGMMTEVRYEGIAA